VKSLSLNEKSFSERRERLMSLNDEELYQKFWMLADQLTKPLAKFASVHTTPSVERSVLLRMGFNSLQAGAFVERCLSEGVIGQGAGGVLLRYASQHKVTLFQAFDMLMELKSWKALFHEESYS
jgi:D-ornithine 4,5-aminomutase subunit alpha